MRVFGWLLALAVIEFAGLTVLFAQGLADNCGNGVARWECSETVRVVTAVVVLGFPCLVAFVLLRD